mmetsp:Transcript_13226/g.19456  ORF Transcript_13226/g.19456 Transcript_13226/m.19456 type:complete len:187 (-) Transcript_13226:61-621(-)
MVEKEQKIAAEKKAAEQKAALSTLYVTAVIIAACSIMIAHLMPKPWHTMKVSLLIQSRVYLSAFFIYIGLLHFDKGKNDLYIAMTPPFLPARHLLHKFAGVLEILGGSGLILGFGIDGLTNASAWLLIILLWSILPTHVYCTLSLTLRQKAGISFSTSLLRMAVQFIFMEWARIHTAETLEDTLGM